MLLSMIKIGSACSNGYMLNVATLDGLIYIEKALPEDCLYQLNYVSE